MALVESLQKAIDYMETHLLDGVTIEEIAKAAHLSPYHFQRTFVILTDISVGEYMRRRRLTKAAQELMSTDAYIFDLAYKYGYDTPESFSKAFRKQHGVTPSEARKGLGKLQSYNRLTIQVELKGAEPMDYKMMERDAFRVAGIKQTLVCDEEAGPVAEVAACWAEAGRSGLINRLAALNQGEIQGLIGMTAAYDNSTNELEYWIATDHGNADAGEWSVYEVPAAKWAVFQVTGPVRTAVPAAWKKIYSEWFPSNGYDHAGAPSLEVYKSSDPTSPDALTEIWVPVK